MLQLDFLLNFFSVIVWVTAARRAGRLGMIPQAGKLRRRVRVVTVLAWSGLVLATFKTVLLILLGLQNWLFVEDKVLLQLPILLFPIAAVLLFSMPKLRDVSSRVKKMEDAGLTGSERIGLFEPSLLFPLQAAGAGAVLVFGLAFLNPQAPLEMGSALIWWLLFGIVLLPLWTRLQMRRKRLDPQKLPVRARYGVRVLRSAAYAAAAAAIAAIWIFAAAQSSRLPDRIAMTAGVMDFGGGASDEMAMASMHDRNHSSAVGMKSVSVADLTGPQTGVPDYKITLTAAKKNMKLASGAEVEAWTFNGMLPGPELRFRQGDLVEVTLVNRDIKEGVTLHWHGLDVPNGEDGVAGLTQDAVKPGGSHVYRFRAEQTGTYWYHSHQMSSEQVRKGLFGPLIVEPSDSGHPEVKELTVINHEWELKTGAAAALGSVDRLQRLAVSPGTPVRIRMINSDNGTKSYYLSGVPFRVAAIDGTDLHEPDELVNKRLLLAAGGRYDLTFVMPDRPVVLAGSPGSLADSDAAIALFPHANGTLPAVSDGPVFDPSAYGTQEATPFGPNSRFDRKFTVVLDNKPGFYDGKFEFKFLINGRSFPDTPMHMVREGELIKTTFVNRSFADHPMHLHGHKMLVLSRNGKPVTGSPWWTDTLNVAPEETYEVAFRADNPGIWMDHCHNLGHAAGGMTMHLAYEGITTPFEMGHATINQPE